MDKQDKKKLYVLIGLLVVLMGSIILNITQYYDLHNMSEKTVIVEKHDTITVMDTITITKPEPAKIVKTKEYIKIPVEVVRNDTVFVEMAKTEKIYKDDSTYECQISGIDPNLDFIKVFPKTTIINNEQTITKTIKAKPHFNWGIQTGVGYGLINRKLDVYIGLGGQYNF